MNAITRLFEIAAHTDRIAIALTRLGLIVVLLWIGGLKAFKYEAHSITPFVANSPLMKFFYSDPGNYKAHMMPEGTVNPEKIAWQKKNQTYSFAYGLGSVLVLFALLLCLHPWMPGLAALGGLLIFLMSFVTLSFLITTPECWVPAAGDSHHGFPYLSGAGRLVLKDIIMMGAGLVVMADSAQAWLKKHAQNNL